jgi:hypothetical protein
MKTLESQIEELKEEHAFKSDMETRFGNYKFTAYISKWKDQDNCINFDLTSMPIAEIPAHIKYIIGSLRCKETETLIGSASRESWLNMSGYTLRFDNGINNHHADIKYLSNRTSVTIKLPVNFYQGIILTTFRRSVTDSEYHYFGGTSMSEIRRMQLTAYKLNIFKEIVWYGSDVTMWIDDVDLREVYEDVLFNGVEDNLKS